MGAEREENLDKNAKDAFPSNTSQSHLYKRYLPCSVRKHGNGLKTRRGKM